MASCCTQTTTANKATKLSNESCCRRSTSRLQANGMCVGHAPSLGQACHQHTQEHKPACKATHKQGLARQNTQGHTDTAQHQPAASHPSPPPAASHALAHSRPRWQTTCQGGTVAAGTAGRGVEKHVCVATPPPSLQEFACRHLADRVCGQLAIACLRHLPYGCCCRHCCCQAHHTAGSIAQQLVMYQTHLGHTFVQLRQPMHVYSSTNTCRQNQTASQCGTQPHTHRGVLLHHTQLLTGQLSPQLLYAGSTSCARLSIKRITRICICLAAIDVPNTHLVSWQGCVCKGVYAAGTEPY